MFLFWANDGNANVIVDVVLLAMTRQINTCAVTHFHLRKDKSYKDQAGNSTNVHSLNVETELASWNLKGHIAVWSKLGGQVIIAFSSIFLLHAA